MLTSSKAVAFHLAVLSSFVMSPLAVIMTTQQNAHIAVAQTANEPTAFPLPDAIPTDTRIRVDGSNSMVVLNETLKQRFERQYPEATVELEDQGTDAALQALLDGEIDLAAVGRPLTEEERAQGFVEILVSREKIAIIVGADNPFNENLTFQQFAQIFRGEITDWAEVGGTPGPIRFVDRAEISDTRLSLSRYEVFRTAPFETGETAVSVDDDTTAVIEALGSDGISYAIASQVLEQDSVTTLSMHQTLPDNPAYPYSQPRGYVYYQEPTPAAAAFLGFATADPGQAAIEAAREAEANAVAAGEETTGARVIDAPPIGGILYTTSLAYSPDGATIAAASDNGTIRLFDADGKTIGEPLEGLTGRLSTLAFSPDGTRIVGATDDGSIQFWDVDGTALGNPLTGHESAITSIIFSPEGDSIATAGADGTIRRWDLEGNQIGDVFTGHAGAVNSLAFSPSGDRIASAGADGTVRFWDLDGQPIGMPMTDHAGAVNSVAFNPSGEALVSTGTDGTIRLWDLDGNALGTPFEGHEGAVSAAAFIPGKTDLVSAGADGSIRFWDRNGQTVGESIDAAQGAIAALALSPDGSSFLSGGTDGTIQSWAIDGTPVGEPVSGYISSVTPANGKLPAWIWWLLPLALLVPILWWLSRRSDSAPQAETATASSDSSRLGSSTVDGPDTGHANVSSHLRSAFSLAESGKSEESLASFDRAVQAEPVNTLAWTARGNLLNVLDKPDSALDSFNKALKIQADVPQALVGKGTALTKLGQVDEALPLFDRAVTANDKLPTFNIGDLATGGLLLGGTALTVKALSGKGFALLDAQRPHDALEAFDAALSHDSGSVDAIAGRNRALGLLGNRGQEAASSQSPAFPSADESASAKSSADATPSADATSPADATSSAAPSPPPATPPALSTPSTSVPTPSASSTPSASMSSSAAAKDMAQMGGAVKIAGGAVLAGVGTALSTVGGDRDQSAIEAKKFDVGQADLSTEDLADVDKDLPELPDGYGESRIVLLPRDPQWAYAYWDIPNDSKEALRQQGGEALALRLYDVTDVDLAHQNPHSMQQSPCDELARDWYVPIPVSDRDYLVEIGYVTGVGTWLMLARSSSVRVPPIYPSDWLNDQFLTVNWDDDLRGKTLLTLNPPDQSIPGASPIHDQVFQMAQSVESLRVAGSLFGSMQHVPQPAVSSYVFPSGMGMWSASGAGMMMSGIGMSGVGFSASAPPIRPRQFWLVADAELIVYGATEPDATVTIEGRPITLDPDGTFRFQMSFQDGQIDFPIMAVAADGEQTRSIHLTFERDTPVRNTNTKEDATPEWPSA